MPSLTNIIERVCVYVCNNVGKYVIPSADSQLYDLTPPRPFLPLILPTLPTVSGTTPTTEITRVETMTVLFISLPHSLLYRLTPLVCTHTHQNSYNHISDGSGVTVLGIVLVFLILPHHGRSVDLPSFDVYFVGN